MKNNALVAYALLVMTAASTSTAESAAMRGPQQPRRRAQNSWLSKEIIEWNAEIDRRKAEKKAAKLARRIKP